MVGMASALGLSVVGEGVETAEQATALEELGCNLAQGYLIARPLAPEAAVEWLRAKGSDWRR
jgi:EAL domain-containing protein (putative c-di-GMP-specific phosphodiesterase class I)